MGPFLHDNSRPKEEWAAVAFRRWERFNCPLSENQTKIMKNSVLFNQGLWKILNTNSWVDIFISEGRYGQEEVEMICMGSAGNASHRAIELYLYSLTWRLCSSKDNTTNGWYLLAKLHFWTEEVYMTQSLTLLWYFGILNMHLVLYSVQKWERPGPGSL